MARQNPFDQMLSDLVEEMQSVDHHFADMASGVPPFDSVKTSPEEDALIFDHPAARYPGATDPQTGVPLTNAQAAQRMLQEMGVVRYLKWVDSHAKRLGMYDSQEGGNVDASGPDDSGRSDTTEPADY